VGVGVGVGTETVSTMVSSSLGVTTSGTPGAGLGFLPLGGLAVGPVTLGGAPF